MVYAGYDYYFYGPYHGTLDAEGFARLAIRASSYIDYVTQNRAKGFADSDAVKMCCCALADQYKVIEDAEALARGSVSAGAASGGAEIQSETVGGYSRTLRSGGDSAISAMKVAAEAKIAMADIAREYLANTGLLYRGRCFECTPRTP